MQEALDSLIQINCSVNYLKGLVDQVKADVDSKILWATTAIGGDKTTLVLVLQHCLLLVAGVLVSLFLQLSIACRLSLLIVVLFNIALVYNRQPLTLLSLSGTIVGLWTVSTVSPVCWLAFNKYKADSIKSHEHSKTHGKEEEEEVEDDKSSTKSSTRSENSSGSHGIIDNGLSYNKLDHNEDRISLSSLRHRSSPTGHSICAAVCRNGQFCRSSVTPGRKFCKRHISH
uniref:Uncharacterized protein n=2 Tax=Homalodisca liturata TaxID=320908 RepID=A0A1B6H5B4_9HEMI